MSDNNTSKQIPDLWGNKFSDTDFYSEMRFNVKMSNKDIDILDILAKDMWKSRTLFS